MNQKIKIILIATCYIFVWSCRKPNLDTKYDSAIGRIIAKESCTGVELNDYVVIELYHPINQFKDGDSLWINGVLHTNVVKGIISNPPSVRAIGTKISFDFEKILPTPSTQQCTIANPTVYPVKVVTIRYGAVGEYRG
jgi:hypothetical protein